MTEGINCIDCGDPLPAGSRGRALRCKRCSNQQIATSLMTTPEEDAWVLEQAKTRPVSAIAAELNLTPAAVYHRIKQAKGRANVGKADG